MFYVVISAAGYVTDEWLGNWKVYRRHKGVRRADTFVFFSLYDCRFLIFSMSSTESF